MKGKCFAIQFLGLGCVLNETPTTPLVPGSGTFASCPYANGVTVQALLVRLL